MRSESEWLRNTRDVGQPSPTRQAISLPNEVTKTIRMPWNISISVGVTTLALLRSAVRSRLAPPNKETTRKGGFLFVAQEMDPNRRERPSLASPSARADH